VSALDLVEFRAAHAAGGDFHQQFAFTGTGGIPGSNGFASVSRAIRFRISGLHVDQPQSRLIPRFESLPQSSGPDCSPFDFKSISE
jgi:hypothetical protein